MTEKDEMDYEKSYTLARKLSLAIVNGFEEYKDMGPGAHLFALRTAIVSILHFFSKYDSGGGVEYFIESLGEEYKKMSSVLEQMKNADKGMYN